MKAITALVCLLVVAALAAPVPATAQQPPATPQPAPPAPPPERPVTMAQALTQAVQNNLTLRIAAFEVQVTRAQLAAALGAKAGSAAAVLSYQKNNTPPTVIVIPGFPPISLPALNDIYVANATYTYPLYTGGALEAQIALARAGVRGAEAALARTTQEITLQTRLAYFGVLVAQAGVEVAQQSVTTAEETLRIAQARVRAGTSPRFDEIQADVNVANARQGLVRARNGVAVATQGLAAVLGMAVDTPLRPQESMEVLPVRAGVVDLVGRGLRERPEFVEHQARVDAARAALELARAGLRPVVGLTGGLAANGIGTGNLALVWSVSLGMSFPLFDGGVTAQKIKEVELRLEQLKLVEAQLRQGIELQVRQAALNLGAAGEELATAGKTIEQAREALRLAQVRFREGVGTNLEVIAAQAALSQADAARVQALFSYNTARAQLERAVGGPVQ